MGYQTTMNCGVNYEYHAVFWDPRRSNGGEEGGKRVCVFVGSKFVVKIENRLAACMRLAALPAASASAVATLSEPLKLAD